MDGSNFGRGHWVGDITVAVIWVDGRGHFGHRGHLGPYKGYYIAKEIFYDL